MSAVATDNLTRWTRDGDTFVEYDIWGELGWPTLKVGETAWLSPPTGFDSEYWPLQRVLQSSLHEAARLAKQGVHYHVQQVGTYVRVRRLRHPTAKLADWRELNIGERMLVNPASTPEDIERANVRLGYMRHKGQGRFLCYVDEVGALWVTRPK